MRELLYCSYLYQASQFFYYEVLMKTIVPFNQIFKTICSMKDCDYVVFTIRSYSISKKIWVKTSLKLKECILMLINKEILNESILLNTFVNYSQLKTFAGIVCRLVKMKNKENLVPVKLLPELEFTESEDFEVFEGNNSEVLSISDMYEQDFLLYESVHSIKPVVIIGVYFNKIAEEFVIKVYKPLIGALFRIPIKKGKVFARIPFSNSMLRGKAYLTLGKKVFEHLLEKILKQVC